MEHAVAIPTPDAPLPQSAGRASRRALIVGILGVAVSFPGLTSRPDLFFHSYLLAFVFWNGIAVGSLAVLMLQYLTGGAWGIAIRRPARGED